MSSEKFNIELTANALQMRQELDKAQKEIKKLRGEVDGAEQSQGRLSVSSSKLGGAIGMVATSVIAATTAFTAYAAVQGRAIRETQTLATMAGVSVEEFKRLSFVMGTAGISGEKFGDIMKDTQERIGDFLATGGGAFQDFADVMSLTEGEAVKLAKEFETMSGDQVLQAMVDQMQAAGKSTQQMSFALEGMASDTTRLIPLLKDGGKQAKELGDRFDDINIELSADEQKQFTMLADNVDLAQSSFVNFINNAISPFLPAINEAAQALTDFFASANAGIEIDQIINDKDIIKDLNSIDNIDKLLRRVKKEQAGLSDQIQAARERGNNSAYAKVLQEEKNELTQISAALREQKEGIEKVNAEKAKIPEAVAVTGGTTSEASGADKATNGDALLDELEALQDAKKTKLQLLREEKDERLMILQELYEGDAEMATHYGELKQQVENDFKLKVFEESQTGEEQKIQAYADELANLKEFYSEKLMTEEDYYARKNEIIAEFAPSILDPELLEEENKKELEALKEKLEQKLILEREYFEEIAKLQKKDSKEKESDKKKEKLWSDSSTKKQLDDGTQLLQSLGNNSKTAHKIKQGLAASNVVMTTAENVTEAFPDPFKTTAAILTGVTQLAAIRSSTADGGGTISAPTPATQEQAVQSVDVQETTVTDISGGSQSSSQVFTLEFSDDVVDVLARKVEQAKSDGRV